MIAACPKCSARYRIEKGRLRPEGARLRCSRCEAVFRVRPPEADSAPVRPPAPEPSSRPLVAEAPPASAPAPPVRAAAASEVGPEEPAASKRGGALPAAQGVFHRDEMVLVADSVIEEGKATASVLAAWGLQPILVHDGVEAILTIQRTLPRTAIIDAALPKMYGFQICELLKRNESLRDVHVILVGAIHDGNRYRRSPAELYGADAYLERPQLPDALWPILHGFGIPLARGARAPAREPEPALDAPPAHPAAAAATAEAPPEAMSPEPTPAVSVPVPALEPTATPRRAVPESAPTAPALDPEIAKAERLARIVVSDIILYNQEKFDAAIEADDVLTAMDAELNEGRTLFAQRIDARVRESRDFLTEELLRVAGRRRSR